MLLNLLISLRLSLVGSTILVALAAPITSIAPGTSLRKGRRQRSAKGQAKVEEVDFPLLGYTEPPEVAMVFYRDRADGPIHAISFCVTDKGQVVKKVKPKHLKGVPQRQLRAHIKQVIGLLKVEFGDGAHRQGG